MMSHTRAPSHVPQISNLRSFKPLDAVTLVKTLLQLASASMDSPSRTKLHSLLDKFRRHRLIILAALSLLAATWFFAGTDFVVRIDRHVLMCRRCGRAYEERWIGWLGAIHRHEKIERETRVSA